MPLVVFLRGVNVGGHKAFQPSVFARKLGGLEVKSVGAAGTFLVRGNAGETTVRSQFVKHMPFEAHVIICTAREIVRLVRADPFQNHRIGEDIKGFVSVLASRPGGRVRLPIQQPEGKEWQVAVIAVQGRFAVSLQRGTGRTFVYPNEVVEKRLGVAATTRSWNTILNLCRDLESE